MYIKLQTFRAWAQSVRSVIAVCGLLVVGGAWAVGLGADVTTQPKPWDQCTPAELGVLAKQFRQAGPKGQEPLASLAEHTGKRYLAASASGPLTWPDWLPLIAEVAKGVPAPVLERMVADIEKGLLADQAAVRSVPPGTWRRFVSVAVTTFQPAQKARWAESLHAAFLAGAQGVAVLERITDVEALANALRLLGDERADATSATFVAGAWNTDTWLSWSPADLDRLVGKLPPDEAERRKITDRMTARLLSARKDVGSMSAEDWQRLIILVGPGLPAERRSQLLEGLRGAFYGEAGGFQSLDPKGRERLARAMKALGAAPEDIADLPVKFVLEKTGWRAWDANGLLALTGIVGNRKDEKAQSVRALLFRHIQARYLTDESAVRSVPCAKWKALAQSLGGDASKEAKADWAEKLGSAFAADPKVLSGLTKDQVADLVETMRILGSTKADVVVLTWLSSRPKS